MKLYWLLMSILKTGFRLSKNGFLAIMILFFSSVLWYAVFSSYVLRYVVDSSADNYLIAYAAFNFVIITTLMLSIHFIHKFNKIHIIYESFSITSIVSIALLFTPNLYFRLIIVFIAGAFFSIGQLASFTYFWSLTISEERGRVAGLIGFFVLTIGYLVVGIAETFDFFTIVIFSIILSSGILVIRLLRPEKNAMLSTKEEKGNHPEKRTILLYSVPWIVFSLVNSTLARNISLQVFQSVPSSIYMFLLVIQMIASGFGALGGGIIADLFGRRLSLGFSLTLYGISTALGGFIQNYEMLYFMYIINGLSWGILWILYSSVIWGDLADKESCAKRYSIGLIIYYLATGLGSLLTHQISQISIINSSLIGCLFIFLSNIPLILAPETLTLNFRQKIRLTLYMNIIKKIRRKQPQNHG